MTNNNEWGEWFLHDGSGYPSGVIGRVCQVIEVCRKRGEFSSDVFVCLGQYPTGGSWNWKNYPDVTKVIRYRIRKPRALLDLIQLIADLPAPTQPMKTDGVIA